MSRISDYLDPYQCILQKTLDKSMLLNVDWEITYACNLRCTHCYQTGPTTQRELSTNEAFSVIDELYAMGALYITFTGGEIFLRKDFLAIARYARKKEFALRLFTNGTLIDEACADKIKELHPLSVEISLYGMKKEVHEGITKVAGSYEKTLHSFALLKERNINTIVKCTMMKENIHEFESLKAFAQKINSKFTFAFTVIPRIDGSQEVLRKRLSKHELESFFLQHEWILKGIENGGVATYKPLCAAGINSLYLSPYGEVFPCVVLRKPCGTIRDTPLKEIWRSPFFTKLRNIEFNDLAECAQCTVTGFCDRCAGLALMEQGDLFGISPNDCVLAHARAHVLERIRERVPA